jgi:hypothetical protein
MLRYAFSTALMLLVLTSAASAGSGTITVKDGNGTSRTFDVVVDGSGNYNSTAVICDQAAAASCATVTGSNALKVDGSAVTQPVSATALPLPSNAAQETGGNLATLAGAVSASVVQSNTKQVNGTTTLVGAGAVGTGSQRVAIGQDTTTIAGSAPGTAGTASSNVLTVQGVASMTPLLTNPGTIATWGLAAIGGTTGSPTNALAAGCQYNSSPPTFSSGDVGGIQCTSAGNLQVNVANANANGQATMANSSPVVIASNQSAVSVTGSGTAGSAASGVVSVQGIASMTPLLVNPGTAANWGVQTQGSTTSGQSGELVQGAVTTYASSYTTAQTSPLSLDLAGNLRVTLQASSSKQSGTANTTGTSTTSLIGAVASERIYVKSFSCANTGSTPSLISFQDGSGGTTLWTTIVPAGGGSNLGADAPIFWTTAGNALYFAAGSASTTTYCSAAGYAGT